MEVGNGSDLKKMLILSGNNFSRNELVEYQKIMSNDRDIKNLIKYGSPVRNNAKKWIGIGIRTLCSIMLFEIVLFMTYFLVEPDLNPAQYFINAINTVVFEMRSHIIIFFIITVINIIFDLKYQKAFEKRLNNTYRELFSVEGYETSFKKYFKNKNRPAVPSTLWTPYAGSVVDAQIVKGATELLKEFKIDVRFAGIPYYAIKCIDSITINWTIESDKNSKSDKVNKINRDLKKDSKLFFKEFAIETIAKASEFEKILHGNSKKPQFNSNMVFGIYYFSRYLMRCWNYLAHENLPDDHNVDESLKEFNLQCKENSEIEKFINGRKIYINFDGIEERNEKEYIRSFLELCVNEYFFTFEKTTSHIAILNIADFKIIELNQENENPSFWDEFLVRTVKKSAESNIEIPIKKLMFLKSAGKEPQEKINDTVTLFLGGPEQNASVLELINQNKWDPGKSKSYMGIYENAFDKIIHSYRYKSKQDPDIYLVGCEAFIHGFSKKKQDRNDPYVVLNKILLGNHNEQVVYNVMGFSAIMTAIGTYSFLRDYQKLSSINSESQLGTDYNSSMTPRDILIKEEYGEDLNWKGYFDKYEIANNLIKLEDYLKKFFPDNNGFYIISLKDELEI